MDELSILRRAAAGDADAFELLVRSHQEQVYRLCLRMLTDPEDAQDAAQESFLKAWRSLPGFRCDSAFSTWLYRLTANICLDMLRSRKRRATVPLTQTDADGAEFALSVPDPAATPEQALLEKDTQARLAAALARLDPEQRQLIALRIDAELSYERIAELLDIKEGTVKSRLSRARERLRRLLEK